MTSWADYYDATAARPPRRTLTDALARSSSPGFAVDLGCGEGRDTIELLRRGWSVLAIDSEPAAIGRLVARPDLPRGTRLEARCESFEAAVWPAANLINASFSLPLCGPAKIRDVWAKIGNSLKPGGRFAGQLYGERDGWAGKRDIACLSRGDVERLLEDWHTELFEEEETDAITPRGQPKHWHIFHIVARRAGQQSN